jgi:hypothetical protein
VTTSHTAIATAAAAPPETAGDGSEPMSDCIVCPASAVTSAAIAQATMRSFVARFSVADCCRPMLSLPSRVAHGAFR